MKLCTFDSQCLPSFLLQADIDQSAYNFVRPSIFNVFEKYV